MGERATTNDTGFALECPLCGVENEVWEYGDGSHVHACDQCSAPLVLNVTTTVNYELVGSTSEERAVGEWAGIPGYVVINPKWPDGDDPYMELADDDRLCDDCGGDGFVRHHLTCEGCGGTGLNVVAVAP